MNELKRTELIELKWIARAFNEIIGTNYRVVPNAKSDISKDGLIEIVLLAERIPFAVDGIDSETLNITLEIYMPVNTDNERDAVLNDLNALIGHLDGEIETDIKTYEFASFLEFRSPQGPPQVDFGGMMHSLDISGTMLVSDKERGALIGNHVLTKLSIDVGGTVESGYIPTLQADTSLNFSSESIPTGNDNTLMLMHNSRGVGFSITALMLKRPLEKALLKVINQIGDGIELNEIMTVSREYPFLDEPIVKTYKVTTMELQEQAGAYVSYKIGLHEVKDG